MSCTSASLGNLETGRMHAFGLEEDAVKAFSSSFDKLMASIEGKRQAVTATLGRGQSTATG